MALIYIWHYRSHIGLLIILVTDDLSQHAIIFEGFRIFYYFYNRYGGILYGITNTVATIHGMLSPIVAAALTPNVRNCKLLVIYTHCYEIVKKWSTKTSTSSHSRTQTEHDILRCNPGPNLGQSQAYGTIKPVYGIPTLPSYYNTTERL